MCNDKIVELIELGGLGYLTNIYQLHSLLHLGKRINGTDLWTKNSEA